MLPSKTCDYAGYAPPPHYAEIYASLHVGRRAQRVLAVGGAGRRLSRVRGAGCWGCRAPATSIVGAGCWLLGVQGAGYRGCGVLAVGGAAAPLAATCARWVVCRKLCCR
jgi:hypothetical protein